MSDKYSEEIPQVRWNYKETRLEQRADVNGKAKWVPFINRPDISGLRTSIYRPVPMLNLTSISGCAKKAKQNFDKASPDRKKALALDIHAWNLTWRCIKRSRPALAELLQDENVTAICKAFDAEIEIEV